MAFTALPSLRPAGRTNLQVCGAKFRPQSRIGKQVVVIPDTVKFTLKNNFLTVQVRCLRRQGALEQAGRQDPFQTSAARSARSAGLRSPLWSLVGCRLHKLGRLLTPTFCELLSAYLGCCATYRCGLYCSERVPVQGSVGAEHG